VQFDALLVALFDVVVFTYIQKGKFLDATEFGSAISVVGWFPTNKPSVQKPEPKFRFLSELPTPTYWL
jgi:hypothetical protein